MELHSPVTSVEIAEAFRAPLYRYLLRLVGGDAALAEDLVQDTLLRAHEHLGDLREPRAVQGWLYRIATAVCNDRFRRSEARNAPAPLDSLDEPERADERALTPDLVLDRARLGECVLGFLAALPDSHRAVLMLSDLHGYTDAEIAERIGITVQNVKIRLHRARKQFRAVLAANCELTADAGGVPGCAPRARPRS